MNEIENELIFLSKYFGMRNDYVQAGGGNISIKISSKDMFIKSSGFSLVDIDSIDGYSLVDYNVLKDSLNDKSWNLDNESEIIEKSVIKGRKPSIESFMHSVTDKYTVHIHSNIVNILLCKKNGKDEILKLFPNAIYVEYALPGLELARKINMSFEKNKKNGIIFLENHGIVVSDDVLEKVIEKINYIINEVSKYLKYNIDKYNNVSNIYLNYKKVNINFSNIIYLSEDYYIKNALKKNNGHIWKYLLFPDSIIYCGTKIFEISNKNFFELNEYKKNLETVIILYDNNIYINANSLKKAREIEIVLSASAQIYLSLNSEEIKELDYCQQSRINESKLEKYRKAVIL